MFKKIGLLLLVFIAVVSLVGCGGGKKAVQIKGSDTMVNLGQSWSEEFMKKHPDIPVAVTGGGSGTGIAALINKTTDIAECSRNMEKKEIEIARSKGVDPYETIVGNDGIVVVVAPENPVNKLTIQQLSDIFTGKITNWQAVGGPDKEIVALSRDRNSGTHVFFLEHVVKLGKKGNNNEFAKGVLMMPSNQAIVEEVSGNSAAIGYIGLGYLNDRLKAVAVGKTVAGPYITPSIKTVGNKTYSVSRPLYMYTNGVPSGEVKTFIDFVLSDEGQKVVLDMDFVPIR
ncbi:MAG: phosphate ABC transporter substrate-binding protein [Candidatus Margulisbacteria bacterium]|nr:phosphate ABC transporter substrate-binding protein [Candidatus Margulisiibacteriota bacterium]